MSDKTWKENPVVVSLLMITVVAGGLTGLGTITGSYDRAHTSAAELQVVQNKIDETELSSKCRALSIQISLADSSIWQMEQSENPGRRLIEVKRELRKLQAQYDDAHCASVLAKG